MSEYEAPRIEEHTPTGIVVVVDLPQPLHKVSQLLEALGNIWPGNSVNVKPKGPAAQLGNWLIHIEGDDG